MACVWIELEYIDMRAQHVTMTQFAFILESIFNNLRLLSSDLFMAQVLNLLVEGK